MQTYFSETIHNEYSVFVKIEEKTKKKKTETTGKGWREVPSVRISNDVLA